MPSIDKSHWTDSRLNLECLEGASVSFTALHAARQLGIRFLSSDTAAGSFALFIARSLRPMVSTRRLGRRVALSIQETGIRCLPVILVVGVFTGLVIGLQGYYVLARFGSKGALGTLVALTLIRELAPVLAAIMIVGQAGSALASELGIQRNSEQIAALETMDIEPLGYLVTPRLLGALVVFPVLTMFFTVVGIVGGWLSASMVLTLESGVYWSAVRSIPARRQANHPKDGIEIERPAKSLRKQVQLLPSPLTPRNQIC